MWTQFVSLFANDQPPQSSDTQQQPLPPHHDEDELQPHHQKRQPVSSAKRLQPTSHGLNTVSSQLSLTRAHSDDSFHQSSLAFGNAQLQPSEQTSSQAPMASPFRDPLSILEPAECQMQQLTPSLPNRISFQRSSSNHSLDSSAYLSSSPCQRHYASTRSPPIYMEIPLYTPEQSSIQPHLPQVIHEKNDLNSNNSGNNDSDNTNNNNNNISHFIMPMNVIPDVKTIASVPVVLDSASQNRQNNNQHNHLYGLLQQNEMKSDQQPEQQPEQQLEQEQQQRQQEDLGNIDVQSDVSSWRLISLSGQTSTQHLSNLQAHTTPSQLPDPPSTSQVAPPSNILQLHVQPEASSSPQLNSIPLSTHSNFITPPSQINTATNNDNNDNSATNNNTMNNNNPNDTRTMTIVDDEDDNASFFSYFPSSTSSLLPGMIPQLLAGPMPASSLVTPTHLPSTSTPLKEFSAQQSQHISTAILHNIPLPSPSYDASSMTFSGSHCDPPASMSSTSPGHLHVTPLEVDTADVEAKTDTQTHVQVEDKTNVVVSSPEMLLWGDFSSSGGGADSADWKKQPSNQDTTHDISGNLNTPHMNHTNPNHDSFETNNQSSILTLSFQQQDIAGGSSHYTSPSSYCLIQSDLLMSLDGDNESIKQPQQLQQQQEQLLPTTQTLRESPVVSSHRASISSSDQSMKSHSNQDVENDNSTHLLNPIEIMSCYFNSSQHHQSSLHGNNIITDSSDEHEYDQHDQTPSQAAMTFSFIQVDDCHSSQSHNDDDATVADNDINDTDNDQQHDVDDKNVNDTSICDLGDNSNPQHHSTISPLPSSNHTEDHSTAQPNDDPPKPWLVQLLHAIRCRFALARHQLNRIVETYIPVTFTPTLSCGVAYLLYKAFHAQEAYKRSVSAFHHLSPASSRTVTPTNSAVGGGPSSHSSLPHRGVTYISHRRVVSKQYSAHPAVHQAALVHRYSNITTTHLRLPPEGGRFASSSSTSSSPSLEAFSSLSSLPSHPISSHHQQSVKMSILRRVYHAFRRALCYCSHQAVNVVDASLRTMIHIRRALVTKLMQFGRACCPSAPPCAKSVFMSTCMSVLSHLTQLGLVYICMFVVYRIFSLGWAQAITNIDTFFSSLGFNLPVIHQHVLKKSQPTQESSPTVCLNIAAQPESSSSSSLSLPSQQSKSGKSASLWSLSGAQKMLFSAFIYSGMLWRSYILLTTQSTAFASNVHPITQFC